MALNTTNKFITITNGINNSQSKRIIVLFFTFKSFAIITNLNETIVLAKTITDNNIPLFKFSIGVTIPKTRIEIIITFVHNALNGFKKFSQEKSSFLKLCKILYKV